MSEAVSGGIRFTLGGNAHTVNIAGIRNTVEFERHFNVSAQVLTMAPRLEYIAFMAWTAARSAGIEVPDTFDGFLDAVDNLEVVENEAQEANPTDGGQ